MLCNKKMLNIKAKYVVKQRTDGKQTGSILGVDKKQKLISTIQNKLILG